jgi:hypothetical protein
MTLQAPSFWNMCVSNRSVSLCGNSTLECALRNAHCTQTAALSAPSVSVRNITIVFNCVGYLLRGMVKWLYEWWIRNNVKDYVLHCFNAICWGKDTKVFRHDSRDSNWVPQERKYNSMFHCPVRLSSFTITYWTSKEFEVAVCDRHTDRHNLAFHAAWFSFFSFKHQAVEIYGSWR